MEDKRIKINGLSINYKIIGSGNIPIILLHGWGISSDKYIETIKQLAALNSSFAIFAPDLPGFGRSENPPAVWGVDDYSEWLKNYSAAINVNDFILIGHSFGGRVAIKFAAKYPEKLKALILTGAAGIKHSLTMMQRLFYLAAKAGKMIFDLPLLDRLEGMAKKLLYKAVRERDYYEALGIMKEVFKKVTAEDLTPYLKVIKIPTLIIWGKNDRSTPLKDGELMHAKIQNSKLEILDDADHRAPYQKPEKFAKIIEDFVNSASF